MYIAEKHTTPYRMVFSVYLPYDKYNQFVSDFPFYSGDRVFDVRAVGTTGKVVHILIDNYYMTLEQLDYLADFAASMGRERRALEWRHWVTYDYGTQKQQVE